MTRPLRLLLVTKSTGGVAAYVTALVRGLDRAKFSITVACLSENGAEFAAELMREYGVKAFSLAMNRYRVDPLSDARVLWQLSRHIRKNEYDLIHAHASKPGFLTRFAALGTGIPVLYSPHNFAFHEGAGRLSAQVVALLERIAARFTYRIIAVANHEKELALQYHVGQPELYEVVHTGIDACPFRQAVDIPALKSALGIPVTSQVVGAVGRLASPKLPLDFVRAALKVRQTIREVRFIWVGSGPLEAEAKAFAAASGLEEVVHWLGHRSDVPALMRIFDCFVLPSRWEGFPLVILEAFASGVPVVATRNLGSSEIIQHGRNGWLVAPDDIDTMAKHIVDMLVDPEHARTISAAGRDQIDKVYTPEMMLSSLTQMYEHAVARN